MKLPQSSAEMLELFRHIAPREADVIHKKMFGYPSCFCNGNFFLGVHGDLLVLRLPDDSRHTLIDAGAVPFEPMAGRPMRGYAAVPLPAVRTIDLPSWVAASLAYARTLPVKVSAQKASR